jgi:hypothetical protein
MSAEKGEVAPLRYYFHFVSCGNCYEDKMGDEFASHEEALAYARCIAKNLGLASSSADVQLEQAVLVVNGKGQEIALVSIKARRNNIESG